MRREEAAGNLDREGHTAAACHSQGVAAQSPCHIREQHLGYLGTREVRQGPGSETAAGKEEEAQEESRREDTGVAGPAGCGIAAD